MQREIVKPQMHPLVLVGGGGHCKSVIEAAESAGISIYGILDLPHLKGQTVLGYPVLGSDDDLDKYVRDYDFIVTLGFIRNASARVRLHEMIEEAGGRLGTVIASTASVSPHAEVQKGTVILHHASVNAGAVIGKGCIINTASNIEHDAFIGDFCHVSTGAMVNGDCRIGDNCFVGSGVIINNGVTVVSDTVISSGSLVRHNLKIPGIYNGNPAVRTRLG